MGLRDPDGEVLPWTRHMCAGTGSDARAAGRQRAGSGDLPVPAEVCKPLPSTDSACSGGINSHQPAVPLTACAGDTRAEVHTWYTHGDEPTPSPTQGQIPAQSATVLHGMAWDGQTDTQSPGQLQREGRQKATLGSPDSRPSTAGT